ncbi:MAG: hypothetical protein R8J41_11110 [Alphaproteobacteria bacterium]|nr:hypothetical protein [Alphaproteobacteria bacterium]
MKIKPEKTANEINENDLVENDRFEGYETTSEDYLSRFIRPSYDVRAGRFKVQVPREQRRQRIKALLDSENLLPWTLTHPHRRSIAAAERLCQINSYDEGHDIGEAASRMTGLFTGSLDLQDVTIESVLLTVWVQTESAIRCREIRSTYFHRGADSVADLRRRLQHAKPHRRIMRDAWLVSGPVKGSIFNAEDRRGLMSNYPLGDYGFNEADTRVETFTAWVPYNRDERIIYSRCAETKVFDRAFKVLNAIEEPACVPDYSDLALA